MNVTGYGNSVPLSVRYFNLQNNESDIIWDCRLNSECSKIMPELAFHGLKSMWNSASRNEFDTVTNYTIFTCMPRIVPIL